MTQMFFILRLALSRTLTVEVKYIEYQICEKFIENNLTTKRKRKKIKNKIKFKNKEMKTVSFTFHAL